MSECVLLRDDGEDAGNGSVAEPRPPITSLHRQVTRASWSLARGGSVNRYVLIHIRRMETGETRDLAAEP